MTSRFGVYQHINWFSKPFHRCLSYIQRFIQIDMNFRLEIAFCVFNREKHELSCVKQFLKIECFENTNDLWIDLPNQINENQFIYKHLSI